MYCKMLISRDFTRLTKINFQYFQAGFFTLEIPCTFRFPMTRTNSEFSDFTLLCIDLFKAVHFW